MTMEQADEVLRYQETYHSVGGGSGVLLYHTAQLPSNFRCEDEHVSASIQDDGEIKGLMWGIYDGHA